MRHSTLGGSQDINLTTEAKADLQQDLGALKYAPMRKHPCLPPPSHGNTSYLHVRVTLATIA